MVFSAELFTMLCFVIFGLSLGPKGGCGSSCIFNCQIYILPLFLAPFCQIVKLKFMCGYITKMHLYAIIFQWRIQDFPAEGRQYIIWLIFPENCMKIKKFWPGERSQWVDYDPLIMRLRPTWGNVLTTVKSLDANIAIIIIIFIWISHRTSLLVWIEFFTIRITFTF